MGMLAKCSVSVFCPENKESWRPLSHMSFLTELHGARRLNLCNCICINAVPITVGFCWCSQSCCIMNRTRSFESSPEYDNTNSCTFVSISCTKSKKCWGSLNQMNFLNPASVHNNVRLWLGQGALALASKCGKAMSLWQNQAMKTK